MDPEIKAKICELFILPPEHDLIRQTELCVFQMAAATTTEDHINVYLKIDAIVKQALRLQLEVWRAI